MDKYEYQVCADQIKSLIKEHRFTEAMDIADTIDWRRVKSFSMLCTVSEIYKVTKHYSEARDILLLAYERYPDRANVVYALCELAIKLDDISESVEYYKEYVRLKPHDSNRYVLLYKIYEAQDVPLEEKISLLEEFKKAEYTEKWAYELALLYHKDGQETRCVETCDELVLWFGEGPYVHKALELKMQHAPLTKEQQRKYDGVYDAPAIPKNDGDETVHIYETQSINAYANGASPFETAPIETMEPAYANNQYVQQTMQPQDYVQQPQQQMYGASQSMPYQDIQIQPVNTDKYSTMNLQMELAKNMEELYAKERNAAMGAPYYGSTQQLYEPSQEQFIAQINQAGPVMDMGEQMQPMQQAPYMDPNQMMYTGPQEPLQYNQQMYEAPAITEPVYEQPEQIINEPVQASSVIAQPEPVQSAPEVRSVAPVEPIPVEPEPVPEEELIHTPEPLPVYKESEQVYIAPTVSNNFANDRVPRDLEDKLSEGMDGQISLSLPTDEPVVDEQVPGQIDISDFMSDWEAKKRSAEEQRKAQIKAKSLSQTSDIMSQLVGVIPGIDSVAEPEPVIEEPKNESLVKSEEEILRDDKNGVVTKTTIASPTFDRSTAVKRTESGSVINGPLKSSITGQIPDILPSADLPVKGDILPSGRKLTLDEEYGGNIAQIRQIDADLVRRMTGELPEVAEPENVVTKENPDYGETEEIEEIEQPELPDEEEDKSSVDEIEVPEVTYEEPEVKEATIEKIAAVIEPEVEEASSEISIEDDSVEEVLKEEINDEASEQEEESEDTDDSDEPITYPYDVDDMGEVEDLVDIEQPDDVDDMLKTRPIPIEEIEARERYEAGIEEDYSEEPRVEQVEKKSNRPSYMVMEEDSRSRRDFDDAEIQIFGRYEGIESLKAQIVDVMDDMSMEARRGNVIVMGSELFGRKSLSIDIVKAIQIMDSSFSGKVAKISGEALNKKNIPVTLSKLNNGALIVENAGGLTPLTINSITESLLSSNESILVVFEDEKDNLEPLLNGCPETKAVFDSRIVMQDFGNDELVAYAKGYAREQGYSIDEMGTLALHTRIADMQTYDHVVSIDEAMEIIDGAIRHVDKKNMSHFMDVLLAKRYDDDDYIVLREKDFIY